MPRLLELLITIIMIVLLAPIMLLVGACVLISMGRPVFFRQHRHGAHGSDFEILKFRTMTVGNGSDESRLTSLGGFLRAASLDELPELFNVLQGRMALVGPRPLLPEYLDLYDTTQRRRLDVRPGITGWAQVNGRNAVEWPDRFKLDVWYVDNRSLLLDLRILMLTVVQVFRVSQVSQKGHATQERFKGNTE
ncbi:MAG TPA: sugar transferase [Phycisphaerales bacterium]|nr:sugar transferase [Phycisphaerales bacterium]